MVANWSNETRASLDISFGFLVFVLNLCEISMLSRLKRRWSNYEVVLLSLSVADMLFGLSNVSIGVAYFTSEINEEVFEITATTSFFFVLTSIFHLSWIGIDRLWAVYSPIKHNYLITRKVVAIVLCLTWFSTIFVSLFLILRDELIVEKQTGNTGALINNQTVAEHLSRYERYINITLSSFIVGANFVFVVVYGGLIHTILKRKKMKATMMTKSKKPDIKRFKIGSSSITTPTTSEETRIAITCALITVSFVCFTLPNALAVFLSDGAKTTTLTSLLLQLNSGANSIVYFLRTKTSRWCDRKRIKNNKNINATVLRNMEATTPDVNRKINNNVLNNINDSSNSNTLTMTTFRDLAAADLP